jgi:hypothetical protein
MFNMLIHCTSLGNTPHIRNVHNSFAVEKDKHPIEHVWDWTATCAQRNGLIKNLLIACHGGYVFPNKCSLKPNETEKGGFGIKLGTGISTYNVQLTQKLMNKVSNIYLFVCGGAADSANEDIELEGIPFCVHPDFISNNRKTCSLMAAHTQANVYASTASQAFNISRWTGRFDFGAWEGKVEKFTPGGGIVDVTGRMRDFGDEAGDE